jgi:hypothetical protein
MGAKKTPISYKKGLEKSSYAGVKKAQIRRSEPNI